MSRRFHTFYSQIGTSENLMLQFRVCDHPIQQVCVAEMPRRFRTRASRPLTFCKPDRKYSSFPLHTIRTRDHVIQIIFERNLFFTLLYTLLINYAMQSDLTCQKSINPTLNFVHRGGWICKICKTCDPEIPGVLLIN